MYEGKISSNSIINHGDGTVVDFQSHNSSSSNIEAMLNRNSIKLMFFLIFWF
jgi:hypothetical protein